jgi:hypothetical protein
MPSHLRLLLVLCALSVTFHSARVSSADPVVWTGPNFTFSIPSFADPTSPANQDRLTDNVWITRAGPTQGGIFNAKVENFYDSLSPLDTLWATSVLEANDGETITATNYADLTFTNWAAAFGGPGPDLLDNILTLPAVVHLVTDDIYLNIQFTDFDSSGLAVYERSTPVAIEPTPTGDYNDDGVVDAVDYTVWRNNLGDETEDNINNSGDGMNGVDPADYDVWKQNYGDTVPGAGSGGLAIPEPASIVLLATAIALAPLRRGKRG